MTDSPDADWGPRRAPIPRFNGPGRVSLPTATAWAADTGQPLPAGQQYEHPGR